MINGIGFLSSVGFFPYLLPSVISTILLINIQWHTWINWAALGAGSWNNPTWICTVQSQCESRSSTNDYGPVCSVKRRTIWTLQIEDPTGQAPKWAITCLCVLNKLLRQLPNLNSISVDNLSEEREVKSALGSGFLMLIKLTRCQFSTLLGNV